MTKGLVMNVFGKLATFAAVIIVKGCSEPEEVDTEAVAEEFSERINGDNATAPASAQPTVVPPQAPSNGSANSSGLASNQYSATCDANKAAPFIGKVADESTRLEIMSVAGGASDVRFITPGADYVEPDANNPRLNLLLDQNDIIRDARCG